MGSLGGLSPGGSLAVCIPRANTQLSSTQLSFLPPSLPPSLPGRCLSNTSFHPPPIDWYLSRLGIDERTVPRPHAPAEITSTRRREIPPRCPETAISEAQMAGRNGHVRRGQHIGEYHTDLDITTAGPIHITSRRARLQFNMRHPYTQRAFHEMVLLGHRPGHQRRCAYSHLRRDTLASA